MITVEKRSFELIPSDASHWGGRPSLWPVMRGLCLIFLLLWIVAEPRHADCQSASGEVNGTVTDAAGAVITDVQIVLSNVNTGSQRSTRTGPAGTYSLPDIAPGEYSIRAEKDGFSTREETDVVLQVNQTATLDFTMTVGPLAETLTVVAQPLVLDSSSSALGTVISTQPVNDLPLNGRNFTQLLSLAPGISPISVAQNAGGGSGWGGNALGAFTFPAVNGQRNRSNMFVIDGTNDLAFLGNYNYAPIIDDIQEFKVESHSDLAEFGEVAGGIINVVTKRGTNDFHGSAWEYLRNEQLDARNFFLPTRNPLRQNQFGATFGGPIVIPRIYSGKNRTFVFFAYEGFRQSQATQNIVLVPTTAELNGDFSSLLAQGIQLYNPFSTEPDLAHPGEYTRQPFPGDIIPTDLLSSAAELYAKTLFPAAGPPIPGGNVYDTTKALQRQDSFTLRIDQNFGSQDALFGRLSYFNEPSSSSAGYPGALNEISIYGWNAGLQESHSFGPTATLNLHFGRNLGNDTVQIVFPNAPANFPAELVAAGFAPQFIANFSSAPTSVIPAIAIAGYASTAGFNGQSTQLANNYEFGGDFTKIVGRHTLKAGYNYTSDSYFGPLYSAMESFSSFQTSNLENPGGPSGAGTGNALASFLLGVPSGSEWQDLIETEHGGSVQGAYVQDQYKVTARLSLNVGIRYDVSFWPAYGDLSNGQGYVGDLDLNNGTYIISALPPACSAFVGAPCIPGGVLPPDVAVTQNKNHSLHYTDYGNWQPRFGIAYLFNKATSVRAGYGRSYDEWNGVAQAAQNIGGTWPSIGGVFNYSQNANIPTAFIGNPVNLGGGTVLYPAATPFSSPHFYYNPYLKTPYVDAWNLEIDEQLGLHTILSVAYVGSYAGHLDLGGLMNTATFPGPGDAATVAARQPYPYITPTNYDNSAGNSNYNALEIQFNRRAFNGLTYLASYTWSKSIDLACSGDFGVEGCELQNPYDPRADRGVSGFDLPNIFSGSFIYELPFGKDKPFHSSRAAVSSLISGWQLNGILSLHSGTPYDIIYEGDLANTGNTFVRVNLVGDPSLEHPTPAAWINTSAFAIPAPYTFGDLGRNSLRSDWYRNLDLSLFREFSVEDRLRFQLRVEAFNATNSVVFGVPGNVINAPNFGVVTSTADTPRELQIGLKLLY